jgi:L,D-transpeptidase catalytic domain
MNQEHRRARTLTTAGLVVTAMAVIVVLVSALAGVGRDNGGVKDKSERTISALRHIPLPRPVEPAFVPSNPAPLSDKRQGSWWGLIRTPVAARARPRRGAAPVARLGTRTPEGTANLVSVLGSRTQGGRLWVHVSLPVLPNGTTGWVPREALGGYGFVATRLVVDLERFKITLYRRHEPIFTAGIGVGKAASPTPTGHFYVRDKVTNFDNPFYGPVAFGTSARSSTLTDWPAGGFIGIHGTDQPRLIPGAISHGCIRLKNRDIIKLARLMPVGTPITIR